MIIILAIFSIIFGIIAQKTSTATKIPLLLVLIIFGLILQYTSLGEQQNLISGMNKYTQMVSITMIYVMAGYAMKVEKPAGIILEVGTYPSLILIGIFSVVCSVGAFLFTGTLSIVTVLIIINLVAIAVNSTPVLFINAFNKLDKQEQQNNNNLQMLSAAVFDQVPVFIFILVPMIISIGILNASGSLVSILIQVVLQILILISSITIFYYISKNLFKLLLGKVNDFLVLVLMVIIVNIVIMLLPFLAGQYLTAGIGVGLGLNDLKNYDIAAVKQKFQMLVGLLAFPVMFVSLGMTIKLSQLLNPVMILISVIIYLLFVVTKALLVKKYLKKYQYNADEIRVGIIFTLLTGASYINMAITFQGIYALAGFNNLFTQLSIVGIILYVFSIVIEPVLIGNKSLIKNIFKLN